VFLGIRPDADDIITMVSGEGIYLPFHTLTDNATNDPDVIYPQLPVPTEFRPIDVTSRIDRP
jgi:hypothetical protein